jgi:hypothetical protein
MRDIDNLTKIVDNEIQYKFHRKLIRGKIQWRYVEMFIAGVCTSVIVRTVLDHFLK